VYLHHSNQSSMRAYNVQETADIPSLTPQSEVALRSNIDQEGSHVVLIIPIFNRGDGDDDGIELDGYSFCF